MTRRPHSDVFVGIASFGRRARMLEAAVESLLPQVDRIGVYLNDYPEIPSFLEHPRIDVEISADYGDLRDNGKFFFLGRTDHRFYAAADDDIHYPTDYIEVLKEALVDTGPNSAVAVHGAVYPTPILDMFTAGHVFHFSESLQHVMPVHLVGTGTLLFDQSEWNLDFEEFGEPGMADVWFARSAKKRSARLFVVNRDRDWLRPVDSAGVAHSGGAIPTLYAEGLLGRGRQAELLDEARISEGGYGELVAATLESGSLSERITVSQAIAFDRIRAGLGWAPLDPESARQMADRIAASRTDWDVPSTPRDDLAAYEEAIAGVLCQRVSGTTAVKTVEFLERLASWEENDRATWKSLPYALRFDTRRSRLDLVRRELLTLAARSGPDHARAIWPRLSRSRDDVTADVALDLERAGIDTGFQRSPALVRVGRANWKRAGNLLREFLEIRDWKPTPDLLAWRKIFREEFHTKGIQLLLATTALRGGDRDLARRHAESLKHRWPGDPDVRLMLAMLESQPEGGIRTRIEPVLTFLDDLVGPLGLAPFKDLLTEDPGATHWMSLLRSKPHHPEPPPGSGAPDVSVIMTVHNNSDTVVAAASSILASRGVGVELLIVDDASTDSTPAELAAVDDSRVKVLTNPQNVGPYVSRNRALELASAEFIAIADADDWSHPDRLAYQRDRLEAEPDLLACTVSHLRITPEGTPDLENHLMFFGDGPMTLMFRRDVVDQIGGFDHIRTRGDMEYLSRLRARFGSQALRSFGAPLVLSTSSPSWNSKRFPPDALDRYRAAFRDWHEMNQLSDELYVPLAGTERARFIAPQELVVDFS
mgnify:CR=1 FL=1